MKRIPVLLLIIVLSGFAAFTQSLSDIFYSAVHLQEVKGDLEAAIPLFEKVVSESRDPAMAAKAQLRIGICYEKLGRQEAYTAYEKVVNHYASQAEAVEAAREKLSNLKITKSLTGEAQRGLRLTKIYTGDGYVDSISPDGKKLALIRNPDIWVRNIADGKELRLTEDNVMKSGTLWSPDSRWIAFSGADRNVRVVPANGGPVKTLVAADPESQKTGSAVPVSWDSDSRKVICRVPLKGLLAIPVSGEEVEEIFAFQDASKAKEYEDMTLSPDGKLVAYVSSQGGNKDIYVMPAKGSGPVRITTSPAADSGPKWSYDGKCLAFDSIRTESPEIYAIRISPEGRPEGPEVQVSRGGFWSGHWTRDGGIAYRTAFRIQHIFIANPDGSGEVQLTQFPAFNSYPRWSTDGRRIIFTSEHGRRIGDTRTYVMPSAGGEARFLSQDEKEFYQWSPDGEMRAVAARDELQPGKFLIKLVPAEGGEPRQLLSFDQGISDLVWSPEGKRIIFTHGSHPATYANADEYLKGSVSGLSLVSIESGEVKSIVPADRMGRGVSGCSWAPDGKRIACRVGDYSEWVKGGKKGEGSGIVIADLTTGGSKLIATVADGYRLCWSPDGRSVIFEQRVGSGSGPAPSMDFDLYKIPAEGGNPEKTNIRGRFAQFSPDGKKIAYCRWIGAGYEFWVAENFFPLDKKVK